MALQDILNGLRTLADHAEELIAKDTADVPAPVDHLAAAIADAGLGPVAGGLVVTLFNDIRAQGEKLDAEAKPAPPAEPAQDAPAAEVPLQDVPEAPPADAPAAPEGIPSSPVIGGTAG